MDHLLPLLLVVVAVAVLKVNSPAMMAAVYLAHGNVMSTGVIVVTVKMKPIAVEMMVEMMVAVTV